MPNHRRSNDPLATARSIALTALWLLVCAGMVWGHVRGSGTDGAGPLVAGLALVAVEFALLLAIVRPWSYRRSWLRSAGAFGLFSVIGVFGTVFAMHAGGVLTLHALWSLTVALLFALVTVWSMGAAVVSRVRS